jgi:cell division protease FtsH
MDVLHTMKDALMKYETIDAKQIDDLMARREVRAPSNWHDEHGDTPQGGASVNNGPEAKAPAEEGSAPLSDIDKANDVPAK